MKINKKLIFINILFLLLVILLIIRLLVYYNLTNKLNIIEVNNYKYHCLVNEAKSIENEELISTLSVYSDIVVDDNYVITNINEYYLNTFKKEEDYNIFKKSLANSSDDVEEYIFNDDKLTIRTNLKRVNKNKNIYNSKMWIEDYLSNYSNPTCERISTNE